MGLLRTLEKMTPKKSIFSTVLSKIVGSSFNQFKWEKVPSEIIPEDTFCVL